MAFLSLLYCSAGCQCDSSVRKVEVSERGRLHAACTAPEVQPRMTSLEACHSHSRVCSDDGLYTGDRMGEYRAHQRQASGDDAGRVQAPEAGVP